MLLRPRHSRRRGVTLAEAAIVYPVMLILTIGLAIVGLGVFRYLQVAELAREGARYAAVHGGQWASEGITGGWNTSGTLTTRDDVYNNAILPHAAGLDSSQLANTDVTVTWDDSGEMPTYTRISGNKATNKVTVTVNYRWRPAGYLPAMTLSSTSETTISY